MGMFFVIVKYKKYTAMAKYGKLIASATTKEKLEKLINEYYYSNNWVITDNNMIYNTLKDRFSIGTIVVLKKGRYQFREIQ